MTWFPAGTVGATAGGAAGPTAATILDAWAETSTVVGTPGSRTISAGSNRCLFAITNARSTGERLITGVTYGGIDMVLVAELITNNTGPDLHTALWVLREAGIVAAASTAFAFTSTGGTNDQFRMFTSSYEDVSQLTPVLDFYAASNAVGGEPVSSAMRSSNVGVAAAFVGTNRGTNDGGATENATYANMTEALESAGTNSYCSVGDASTTGADFTPGLTIVHEDVAHEIGFSIGAESTAFKPTDVASLVFWVNSRLGVTGAEVSAWADQSTSGFDLAQATAANQPNTNTINDNPGIFFDGADEFMNNTGVGAAFQGAPATYVSVFTPTDTAGNEDFFNLDTAGGALIHTTRKQGAGFNYFSNGATDQTLRIAAGLVAGQSAWGIGRVRDSTVGASDQLDNLGATDTETLLVNIIQDPGQITIGTTDNQGNDYDGTIHELMVFGAFISDADRTSLINYLNAQWSVGP